jgi:hypothetical protein
MEVFGAPDTVAAIACLDVNAQPAAFAKVIGPLMLAKHFVPRIAFGGSMVLFSGVAAWKPASGRVVTGITSGAVALAVSQLAKELAPARVNAPMENTDRNITIDISKMPQWTSRQEAGDAQDEMSAAPARAGTANSYKRTR